MTCGCAVFDTLSRRFAVKAVREDTEDFKLPGHFSIVHQVS